MTIRSEAGVSLVETMVAILLLAVVSVGFYQVMFSGVNASDAARSLSDVSAEARSALNRMVRDAREASWLTAASPTSFTIMVDFDGNGVFSNGGALGDEVITYAYNASAGTLSLNGELLATGVSAIPGKDPFSYTSNRLEYDWGGGPGGQPDGVTTWQEINDASCAPHNVSGVGDCDLNPSAPDSAELNYLTNIHFALRVSSEGRSKNFEAGVEMRSRR